MRTLIVLLIVAAVAAVALYALGVFDPGTDPQQPADPNVTDGDGDGDPGGPVLTTPPPKERPEVVDCRLGYRHSFLLCMASSLPLGEGARG